METLPVVPIPPKDYGFIVSEEITDVDSSANKYLRNHYGKQLQAGYWLSAIYVVGLGAILFFSGAIFDEPRLLILLVVPFLIYLGILGNIRSKILHEFYKKFAQTNGFSYSLTSYEVERSGSIFQVGHSRKIEDLIEGKIGDFPVAIFNYYYTVGSGKSSRSYSGTVWEIDLKTPVPPMLLLVDWHYFGDDLSDNNINYINKIELDPALEKNFNLYVEKKFEIEALQIFTPDFLNALLENFNNFSLDFTGNCVYIYSKDVIKNKAGLEKLKSLANFLLDRIQKTAPSMKTSIVALQEALEKAPKNNIFAKTSQEISRSLQNPGPQSVWVFVLLFIMFIFIATALISAFTQ
jgi:hypothetical protein